jgi:hypothetical protein
MLVNIPAWSNWDKDNDHNRNIHGILYHKQHRESGMSEIEAYTGMHPNCLMGNMMFCSIGIEATQFSDRSIS